MEAELAIEAILRDVGGSVLRMFACAFLLALIPGKAGSRTERTNLFPKLHAGQTIAYQIRFRTNKNIKTKSNVTALLTPGSVQVDVQGLLRVEIVGVHSEGGKAAIHARTQFETPDSNANLTTPAPESTLDNSSKIDRQPKLFEFTIAADGRVADLQGLDALFPDQQQAWGEWVSLFAMAAAFPEKGVKRGEKWESEEAEKSAAPLAGLVWLKRSTYVRDEPCPTAPSAIAVAADGVSHAPETCAVILATATLKQRSSKKNATPEDFKLHELQTSGTAGGTNQVIAYISLATGLVVRATEEASQAMDVMVAKIDRTNRVHYTVNAKSKAELLLLVDTHIKNH